MFTNEARNFPLTSLFTTRSYWDRNHNRRLHFLAPPYADPALTLAPFVHPRTPETRTLPRPAALLALGPVTPRQSRTFPLKTTVNSVQAMQGVESEEHSGLGANLAGSENLMDPVEHQVPAPPVNAPPPITRKRWSDHHRLCVKRAVVYWWQQVASGRYEEAPLEIRVPVGQTDPVSRSDWDYIFQDFVARTKLEKQITPEQAREDHEPARSLPGLRKLLRENPLPNPNVRELGPPGTEGPVGPDADY
ncbi:hypothetical protein FRB90_005312 [Tulasnella sp. 427]|nr:hypothetical protein FRB90_005312 [Tulasnella sp. 427]